MLLPLWWYMYMHFICITIRTFHSPSHSHTTPTHHTPTHHTGRSRGRKLSQATDRQQQVLCYQQLHAIRVAIGNRLDTNSDLEEVSSQLRKLHSALKPFKNELNDSWLHVRIIHNWYFEELFYTIFSHFEELFLVILKNFFESFWSTMFCNQSLKRVIIIQQNQLSDWAIYI